MRSAGTARALRAANERPGRAGRAGRAARAVTGARRALQVATWRCRRHSWGGARVWRPLAASRCPFPPPTPRLDPGEPEGKSRCAGTREQPRLSPALALLFPPRKVVQKGLRTGSGRDPKGRLGATQVSTFPVHCPVPLRCRAQAGEPRARWAEAGVRAPALGSRSRREDARKGARLARLGAACSGAPGTGRVLRAGVPGRGTGSGVLGGDGRACTPPAAGGGRPCAPLGSRSASGAAARRLCQAPE